MHRARRIQSDYLPRMDDLTVPFRAFAFSSLRALASARLASRSGAAMSVVGLVLGFDLVVIF